MLPGVLPLETLIAQNHVLICVSPDLMKQKPSEILPRRSLAATSETTRATHTSLTANGLKEHMGYFLALYSLSLTE